MTGKQIHKMVREIFGYVVLCAIILTAIILYSKVGALPDAIFGVIVAGGMSGVVAIALNQKEPKQIPSPLKDK